MSCHTSCPTARPRSPAQAKNPHPTPVPARLRHREPSERWFADPPGSVHTALDVLLPHSHSRTRWMSRSRTLPHHPPWMSTPALVDVPLPHPPGGCPAPAPRWMSRSRSLPPKNRPTAPLPAGSHLCPPDAPLSRRAARKTFAGPGKRPPNASFPGHPAAGPDAWRVLPWRRHDPPPDARQRSCRNPATGLPAAFPLTAPAGRPAWSRRKSPSSAAWRAALAWRSASVKWKREATECLRIVLRDENLSRTVQRAAPSLTRDTHPLTRCMQPGSLTRSSG